MSSLRRAVSILCWLAIGGLLVRIAAGGAFAEVIEDPTGGGVAAVLIGVGLIAVGLAAGLGLAAGAAWSRPVSGAAAAVAVAYGVALLPAGHESGSLIAAAGAVATLAALGPGRPDGVPS
jgi:hypothetical protein